VTGNVKLGESCAQSANCEDVNAVCVGVPSVCVCGSNHYDNNGGLSGGICIPSESLCV